MPSAIVDDATIITQPWLTMTASGQPRVLLVDDEAAFLASAAKALQRRGIHVTTAQSGEQARSAFEASPFDVVVLDVAMPDADGHQLFYELKQRSTATQFIVLTGHGDAQRSFEMSFDGLFAYLTKPCEIDVLADLIYRAAGMEQPVVSSDRNQTPGYRVLLIDDEEAFLASMRKVLARRGFEVVTATSGEEGLELLKDHDVDVAIVDLKMPGLGGLEVLSRIKREKPAVEVILLTGHGDIASAIEGMPQGAFDYLLKPYEPDELALRIEVAGAHKRHTASSR
jgi:DNA-binding NtrC family response regulator